MQEHDYTSEQEHCFVDSVEELKKVNTQLAKLVCKKEELTSKIIGILGHNHEGQKSYEHGIWKIEVKTPCVYSLDKKLYEKELSGIPKQFNPVKKSISYTIDKKLCEKYLESAPTEVREILIELIEKRPGKASISIKERAQ